MFAITDGVRTIGVLKPMTGGGFELFIIAEGRQVYLAKVASIAEGERLAVLAISRAA